MSEHTLRYMQQVYKDAPLLKALNEAYKNLSLEDYLQYFKKTYIERTPDKLDPVIEKAIADYSKELIGEEDTKACINVLRTLRAFHTANHHAIAFYPMSVQGDLLYEYLVRSCMETDVIPFFSCTTVTMRNAFYPRGMLMHDTVDGRECAIPVHPFKMRQVSVSHAAPFTDIMLDRAIGLIYDQRKKKRISHSTADTALKIIDEVYKNRCVINCSRYADQVTLANSILSRGYWSTKQSRHIFLDLEEISGRVICHDLMDEDSILNKMLWNGRVMNALKRCLDGVSGCWSSTGAGTFLFWGVDHLGREYRLTADVESKKLLDKLILLGTDHDGNEHRFVLNRQSLIELLSAKKLLPGLFMSYFSLAMVRDICPIGGCFQGDYLRRMCNGLKETWKNAEECIDEEIHLWLNRLDSKSFPYLCGPLFLTKTEAGCHFPLSSVELWEHPISYSDFKKSLEITFEKAHRIGLYCFYPMTVPARLREDDWWNNIVRELF